MLYLEMRQTFSVSKFQKFFFGYLHCYGNVCCHPVFPSVTRRLIFFLDSGTFVTSFCSTSIFHSLCVTHYLSHDKDFSLFIEHFVVEFSSVPGHRISLILRLRFDRPANGDGVGEIKTNYSCL